MKVVIYNIHVDDAIGGAEIQCDLIARELSKRGVDVLYLTPVARGGDYNCPYPVRAIGKGVSVLYKEVLSFGADVVYWRSVKNGFYSASRVLPSYCKLIFSVSALHDVAYSAHIKDFKQSPGLRNLARMLFRLKDTFLQRRSYSNCHGVTFLNRSYMRLVSHDNVKYIPDVYYGGDQPVVPFNWPRPYVVWVANLKPTKRPELFYKMARELEGEGVDFLMVGRVHNEYRDYEWIRSEADWPDGFHYLGERSPEEVNEILAGSVFHVHTCEPEGFGNIFLQAWLMRKPSLSLFFDPDGLIEKYKPGLYAHGCWSEFICMAKTLIGDESYRDYLAANAIELVLQRFSPSDACDELLDFFED